ncbi:hypothetical protein R6Q59_021603 [Mikania micrantha]
MAGRVSPAVILMSVVQKQRQLILNRKVRSLRRWCSKPSGDRDPGNLLLKTAWYGSELLGIAASFFRSPEKLVEREVAEVDREIIVEIIKGDFQRSYFVTGRKGKQVIMLNLYDCSGDVTVDAYEDECEFADPVGSFKGVSRFKRNCTNFGSLIEKSSMKLMKWEDFEDKGVGHWRFRCTMAFPWKPILSATGYTEYYLSKESGKICRHVEHWNVPKMALFKQLLKPSRQTNTGMPRLILVLVLLSVSELEDGHPLVRNEGCCKVDLYKLNASVYVANELVWTLVFWIKMLQALCDITLEPIELTRLYAGGV